MSWQVGWQGASDFLIRNERLAARGLHTYDFGMDYLEEGSSGIELNPVTVLGSPSMTSAAPDACKAARCIGAPAHWKILDSEK